MMSAEASAANALARTAFSWARSDTYSTPVGGKIPSLVDRVLLPAAGGSATNARSISASHAFAQASAAAQFVTPVPSAVAGGQVAAVLTGAQLYQSSIPAVNWSFSADGSGFGCYYIHAMTSTVIGLLYGSTSSGAVQGISVYDSANDPHRAIYPSASPDTVYGAGGTPINTLVMSTLIHATARTPNFYSKITGVAASDINYAVAPAAGAPQHPMQLFANTGPSVAMNGLFLDAIFFNSLAAAVAAGPIVATYARARYGATL